MDTIKLDLHIHSSYSFDSFSHPISIVKRSVKIGLKGIAITDHNKIRGSLIAKKYAKDNRIDVLVITGTEYSTEKGDVLALFVDEKLKYNNIYELIDAVHDRGGIIIKAHPFKREKLNVEEISLYDGLEVFNARNPYNSLVEKIAERYNLPRTGGSDAHFLMEIGRGITLSPPIEEEEDLIKFILKNRTHSAGKYTPFADLFSQTVKMIKKRRIDPPRMARQFLRSTRELGHYISLR